MCILHYNWIELIKLMRELDNLIVLKCALKISEKRVGSMSNLEYLESSVLQLFCSCAKRMKGASRNLMKRWILMSDSTSEELLLKHSAPMKSGGGTCT